MSETDNLLAAIEQLLRPRTTSLGEFEVRRALPATQKSMVGPFVFFDHMGPAEFSAGSGIDVRPHPHIGIATITYLFEGEIVHRDSLGIEQSIRPGEINLMTAGRGIVHSERAGADRQKASKLHGLQLWIALPEEFEEVDPAFDHYASTALPVVADNGVRTTVIMGAYRGHISPVTSYSPTTYLDFELSAGSALDLPADYSERAVYVVQGELVLNGLACQEGVMVVLKPGAIARLESHKEATAVLIGGEPIGKRHLYWNFVSSSPKQISLARQKWANDEFPKVPGDDERIPLPD